MYIIFRWVTSKLFDMHYIFKATLLIFYSSLEDISSFNFFKILDYLS